MNIRLSQAAVLLMVLFFSLSTVAQVITDIRLEGNKSVSFESVLKSMTSRVGKKFDEEQISRDIKALFDLGNFSDIWVEKNSVNSGKGVVLTVHFREKPVISKISFQGNKKYKEKRLREEVTLQPFRAFDEKALVESIKKMRAKYKEKGYYLVDIAYRFESMADGSFELIFEITENKKSYIRKIHFEGNEAFTDKKLKRVIRSKKKGGLSFITGSGKLKEEKLEQDVGLLNLHYLNNGYLKVKVSAPEVDIDREVNEIYLTYSIEEGKPYTISDVKIEGDVLTTRAEIINKLQTKPGQLYNQLKVEEDVQWLTKFYGNVGYAFVNVRPIPIANDTNLTAELNFHITKGDRIRIEKITITGNDKTRDKVIRRELLVKEGDIYNEEAIQKSREKLMQLGYFEEVNFSTPRGSSDDSVNLNIIVKEKATGSFQIGAGFSTVEHFYVSASIVKQNFFGLGISGQISAEVSKLRQQYSLYVTDPYFLDSNWIVGLSTYKSVYNYYDFDRQSLGSSLSLGHRIFDNSQINLGYQIEDVKVTNFTPVVPQLFRDNASGLTSALSLTLSRDTRDNRLFPSKGMYHSVRNEVSGTKLGGDNDFYRTSVNNRFYFPIKWGIVTKFQLLTEYVKNIGNRPVPLFERYFLGGPYSLRGFYPRSIGPRLRMPSAAAGADTEFVYGGNKQLQFNFETDLPIYTPAGFKAVAFFDAGQAFAEQDTISINELRANYGFGLKWYSPLGPLRFEWGFPINRREGESSVLFNFSIGDIF